MGGLLEPYNCMPRVRLLSCTPEEFFNAVQEATRYSFSELARLCNVHRRCFSDWKHGKSLMPEGVFRKMCRYVPGKPKYELREDYWHIQEAAKRGGHRRMELYGQPGTPEGRRKGGKRSQIFFSSNPRLAARAGFKIRKRISLPVRSRHLAEMIGILLGDGGISEYQVTVTLNSVDEVRYVHYVKRLFVKLFKVQAGICMSSKHKGIDIRVSSRELVEYMARVHELAVGDKIRAGATIPKWIESDSEFLGACIRGLVDTDGSFFIDYHPIKDKIYAYPCLMFTSLNPILYESVKNALTVLGFHPTGKKRNIFLRIEAEVRRYFKIIVSSNHKHLDKYRNGCRCV